MILALAVLLTSVNAGGVSSWRLVWHDEFDGLALDRTKWTNEVGFVRNRELQYYTDCRENVRLEDGFLVLEARKEKVLNPKYNPKASSNVWMCARQYGEYTSASINTKGRYSFTYGKLECRARLPKGRGMWPAIWMLGEQVPWPAGGEIDVMENVGWETNRIHGTIHWKSEKSKSKYGNIGRGKAFDPPETGDRFHVYGLEWNEESLRISCDGQVYMTLPVAEAECAGYNPFHHPQFILINLAVGGAWGGKYGIDERAFPGRYEIDWIRVWQRE